MNKGYWSVRRRGYIALKQDQCNYLMALKALQLSRFIDLVLTQYPSVRLWISEISFLQINGNYLTRKKYFLLEQILHPLTKLSSNATGPVVPKFLFPQINQTANITESPEISVNSSNLQNLSIFSRHPYGKEPHISWTVQNKKYRRLRNILLRYEYGKKFFSLITCALILSFPKGSEAFNYTTLFRCLTSGFFFTITWYLNPGNWQGQFPSFPSVHIRIKSIVTCTVVRYIKDECCNITHANQALTYNIIRRGERRNIKEKKSIITRAVITRQYTKKNHANITHTQKKFYIR